jgi:hypothetical protein
VLLLTNHPITGNWIASTPIPDQTLESRETRLEGKDQEHLLKFARKLLRWLPEDRAMAAELCNEGFLTSVWDEAAKSDGSNK